ncbi:unnamed protein product [Ceutorhynchus assimilis]|uniref:SUN domain-containing protein n=1 Tax=Ceutorhynchus assimilis TaxID=467358 RepID=A0A9N9QF04_9CUCU|nr:unnamed protein product [Ceutorhynchus assimilis]
MSTYQGRPLPMEMFPGCFFREHDMLADHRSQRSCWRRYILSFLAGIITVGICCFGLYYFQPPLISQFLQKQLPKARNKYVIVEDTTLIETRQYDMIELAKSRDTCIRTLNTFKEEIVILKEQMATISNWRTNVNGQLTKIQWEQDAKINSAIDEALDIFEADGLGEMDYAATYAGGKILEISRDTFPMASFQTMSLLRLFKVELHSNPEEIIRTCVLPGCCFAFSGSTASIKIRLGKPIIIDAVTLSHGSNRLLNQEGMSTAPKDFEVYGFQTEDDITGTFLGKFTYNLKGRQHQMFKIKTKYSKNHIFYAVELVISSNHGKTDLTCVYRFRVHQMELVELSERGTRAPHTLPKKTKCC